MRRFLWMSGLFVCLLAVFFLVSLMLVARFSMVLFLEGLLTRFGTYLEQQRERRAEKRKLKGKIKKDRKLDPPIVIAPEPVPLPAPKPTKKAKKKKDKRRRRQPR